MVHALWRQGRLTVSVVILMMSDGTDSLVFSTDLRRLSVATMELSGVRPGALRVEARGLDLETLSTSHQIRLDAETAIQYCI